MTDELVSAARRTWIVTVGPKAGFNGPSIKVLVVTAICERTAKLSAWNKAKRGPYKHRAFNQWVYELQEVKDDDGNKAT